jgi:hypothetical protein
VCFLALQSIHQFAIGLVRTINVCQPHFFLACAWRTIRCGKYVWVTGEGGRGLVFLSDTLSVFGTCSLQLQLHPEEFLEIASTKNRQSVDVPGVVNVGCGCALVIFLDSPDFCKVNQVEAVSFY